MVEGGEGGIVGIEVREEAGNAAEELGVVVAGKVEMAFNEDIEERMQREWWSKLLEDILQGGEGRLQLPIAAQSICCLWCN